MARFVYKAHKWLAMAAGLVTLIWFVSGIVMLLPANLLVKPPAPAAVKETAPSFKEIRISVRQAIAAAESAVGGEVEVTSFASKQLMGITFYQIATREYGTFLVNAMDGTLFEITSDVARQIVESAGGDESKIEHVLLLRQHELDYPYGPLPAFKISVNDGRGAIYFVTVGSGEVRSTNRMGRVRRFLAGLHTFDFLRPVAGERAVRVLMLLFAIVGTAMSLFGACILWMQFRHWRQLRRQSA